MATKVLNHTYRHFADLQMSAKDFYDKLQKTIEDYQYPNVKFYRQNLATGGFLSVKREYLCISHEHYAYFVCAAPFGRSYFITWWFQYERSSFTEWLCKNAVMRALIDNPQMTMFAKDTQLMFQNSISSILTEMAATAQVEHGKRVTAPLSQTQLS